MPSWTSRFAPAVVALCTVAGIAMLSPAASMAASTGCGNEPLSQPFVNYNDAHQYFLVPGGDFLSGGSGWTFTGGAQVVSDPLSPTGYAAQIPSGGSITTPPFCVTALDPVLKAFGYTPVLPASPSKHKAADLAGLSAAVVYANGVSLGVGDVPSLSSWAPTRSMSLAGGSIPFVNGKAMVQYRFTAINGATWRLDDVYADPRMLR